MDRRVLGLGGFGCVLHPAIVFSDSVIVNEENKYEFVTKLARDAEDEYDKATLIRDFLESHGDADIGIFPVDKLECGISSKDLGPNAPEIIRKCKKLIYDHEKHIQHIHLSEKKDYIVSSNQPRVSMPRRILRLAAGENDYLCAIQYPKYKEDLQNYLNRTEKIYENRPEQRPRIKAAVQLIEKKLFENMYTLHSHGIVHLDIKPQNISIDKHGLQFADWGFAAFFENKDSLDSAFLGLEDYVNLYERYASIKYEDGDVTRFFPSKMFDVLVEPNMSGIHPGNHAMEDVLYRLVLCFVDRICVCSVLLKLYIALVPDLYDTKLKEFKKYLFETYETLSN